MNAEIKPSSKYPARSLSFLMIWLVAWGIMVAISLVRGQDANWDLRNYHYFGGYVFLHGGFDRHLFPAQIQSWYNPLLSSFAVTLMDWLPPKVATSLFVMVQSANVPLIAVIARQTLSPLITPCRGVFCSVVICLAVLLGATGAMSVSEIGTTMGDSVVSVALLAALALLGELFAQNSSKDRQGTEHSLVLLFISGAAVGAACGLKLTNFIFAPGFVLCLLALGGTVRTRIAYFGTFGFAAVCGLLATDGYWLYHLWTTTGNPLFPLFNSVFRSPLIDPVNLLDLRFRPNSLGEALAFPFITATGAHPGAELGFRDSRFAVFVLLFVPFLMSRPRGWLGVLVGFFASSMALWLSMYGIERYVVALEMLSGVVIIGMTVSLSFAQFRTSFLILISILVLGTGRPPDWGHVAWSSNWFDVEIPPSLRGDKEMFLMLDDYPSAYVIPSFPNDAQFIRMEGNLKLSANNGLQLIRRKLIANHLGQFYSYGPSIPNKAELAMLSDYGLRPQTDKCISLHTKIEVLAVCPLTSSD